MVSSLFKAAHGGRKSFGPGHEPIAAREDRPAFGTVAELDPLPAGVEHLDPQFPPWRAKPERGGGVYAIPYLWGTTGIGYDSDRVEPPRSWSALFDERYAGRISVIDGMRCDW